MPFELLLRRLSVAAWLALAALAAPPVHAQPATGGPPASPVAGSRNVYAGGAQVRPGGPVEGDFMAGGGRIVLDQPVGGDAALAGGAVDVRAPVAGDLRAMGGDVTLESSVGGELVASGGQVNLRSGTTVAGPARLYGAAVTIDGRIDGNLNAGAQKVTINGEVRGDAHVDGGEIVLGPQARIGGVLSYASESELKKAETATVAGGITRREAGGPAGAARTPQRPGPGAVIAGGVMSFLALLACGAVFLLLLPVFGRHAATRVRTSPWLALAVGFAMLVAVPVLAVLLFITLLGIPLGIAVLALYPVMLLAGFVLGVLFIAGLLPAAMRKPQPQGFGASVGWFALALLLVMLAGAVPVVGAVAVALLSLAGIGALVLEIYGRRHVSRAAAPAVVDPALSRSS